MTGAMGITSRVQHLFDQDRLLGLLGAELVSGGPGHVVLRYRVGADIVQAHGTCHGGVIFSLADAACGIAASAGDTAAVTQICTVNFMRPAVIGTDLIATATERSRAGRTIILDVSVTDGGSQKPIAELRATARLMT